MFNFLPKSTTLDVACLSRLFEHKTTSYKLLFFGALLSLLEKESERKTWKGKYSYRSICIEMLIDAWYPHRFFALSFGLQDKVGSILEKIEFPTDENACKAQNARDLRAQIEYQFEAIQAKSLLRYAPYRLLTPFFTKELSGTRDSARRMRINELADQRFFTPTPPLYRICQIEQTIHLHPYWMAYLTQHLPIIKSWHQHHWASFLQSRNPNVPAVITKATKPSFRRSLTKQKAFWEKILGHTEIYCVYSGKLLTKENYALDHFLPWSFVGHDQLWNLIPSDPTQNSIKGSKLPCRHDIQKFIETQHHALTTSYALLKKTEWKIAIESYRTDLKLAPCDIIDKTELTNAYNQQLDPMISLAENMGFVKRR
ncbi:5-methylcytosine-specific restriction endonuclease McrA [Natronospira proteinivora]|uniref:5-methylcytosine-specific restriction endonuclease McrA n=1 Tax=Natronospira proteinivora TaxID=1807133 RepID=A0ABT1GB94_9GAMM|nr:HNH endonuclease domain-containing protein [Natronospira proteinivora]MCP1727608.1 5-methylcytosine-specific restriction endonuclease McrA [Natronospira proteinivora]